MHYNRPIEEPGVFRFKLKRVERPSESYPSPAAMDLASNGRHRFEKWIAIGSIFYLCSVAAISLFCGWFISIMLPPGQISFLTLLISLFEMIAKMIVPLIIFHVLYALISKIIIKNRNTGASLGEEKGTRVEFLR